MGVGLLTAFTAGIVSFLSPCVLPLVPGYVSYIAGQSTDRENGRNARGTLHALALSFIFVLGFSTVFIALGASATMLGQILLRYRFEANLIGGAVVILFGLFMVGLVSIPALQREFRINIDVAGGRPMAAYVLGLAFAFGWTPCIGPVLGAILTVSAVSATASSGVLLLAVYSLGLGLPFLAAAIFADEAFGRIKRLRRVGRGLQIFAGAMMIAMGAAMITGWMTTLSLWFLEAFPGLAQIG